MQENKNHIGFSCEEVLLIVETIKSNESDKTTKCIHRRNGRQLRRIEHCSLPKPSQFDLFHPGLPDEHRLLYKGRPVIPYDHPNKNQLLLWYFMQIYQTDSDVVVLQNFHDCKVNELVNKVLVFVSTDNKSVKQFINDFKDQHDEKQQAFNAVLVIVMTIFGTDSVDDLREISLELGRKAFIDKIINTSSEFDDETISSFVETIQQGNAASGTNAGRRKAAPNNVAGRSSSNNSNSRSKAAPSTTTTTDAGRVRPDDGQETITNDQLSQNARAIQQLTSCISGLAGTVREATTELTTNVGQLTTNVGQLTTTVANHESRLHNVESNQSRLEDNLDDLNSSFTELRFEVNLLKSATTGSATKASATKASAKKSAKKSSKKAQDDDDDPVSRVLFGDSSMSQLVPVKEEDVEEEVDNGFFLEFEDESQLADGEDVEVEEGFEDESQLADDEDDAAEDNEAEIESQLADDEDNEAEKEGLEAESQLADDEDEETGDNEAEVESQLADDEDDETEKEGLEAKSQLVDDEDDAAEDNEIGEVEDASQLVDETEEKISPKKVTTHEGFIDHKPRQQQLEEDAAARLALSRLDDEDDETEEDFEGESQLADDETEEDVKVEVETQEGAADGDDEDEENEEEAEEKSSSNRKGKRKSSSISMTILSVTKILNSNLKRKKQQI